MKKQLLRLLLCAGLLAGLFTVTALRRIGPMIRPLKH